MEKNLRFCLKPSSVTVTKYLRPRQKDWKFIWFTDLESGKAKGMALASAEGLPCSNQPAWHEKEEPVCLQALSSFLRKPLVPHGRWGEFVSSSWPPKGPYLQIPLTWTWNVSSQHMNFWRTTQIVDMLLSTGDTLGQWLL